MSKTLFISSGTTGQGHESIRRAVQSQMAYLGDGNAEIESVDGFSLGHRFFRALSRLYDPVAVRYPWFWNFCYQVANILTAAVNWYVSRVIRKGLILCVKRIKPDLIVTVHPVFVGSVLNVLEHEGLNIPVITLIADLDNVSALWADKRAEYTLCPTEEAKERMLELGVSENRLIMVGFPVREDFCGLRLATPDIQKLRSNKKSVLMISGSQGHNKIQSMAQSLLELDQCHVSVITGNNAVLKKSLEEALMPVYPGRMTIYGFVSDIARVMSEADILVIRASPNVMMEAVNLCKPFILIGALPGQEKKNPDFALRHNLGIECKESANLPHVVSSLFADGCALFNKIHQGQVMYRRPQASREISEFILKVADDHSGEIRSKASNIAELSSSAASSDIKSALGYLS